MRNNRLFTVLRTLERKEFFEFGRYVDKGFLKKGPKAATLLKHIKKYYPDFNHKNLNRDVIYFKLFDKKMFMDEARNPKKFMQDTKRVLDIVADLSNLVEEYIIILRLRKKEVDFQMLRMNALEDKGLDDLEEKAINTLEEELKKGEERGRFYHLNQYRLFDRKYFKIAALGDLKTTLYHLDRFYIMSKLGLMNEMLQRKIIFNEKHEKVLLNDGVLETAKKLEKEDPVMAVYYLAQHLFNDDYEAIFHRLRKLAYKYQHLGNPDERLYFITILINASIIYTQRGDAKFQKFGYGLYHFGLRNEILIINGNLHDVHFQNIVEFTMNKKGADYTRFIIRKYVKYLHGDKKEGGITIYDGYLLFKTRQYQEVVNLLRNKTFRYYPYELKSRAIVLRSCYELELNGVWEDNVDFDKVCEAFEKYLKRHDEISEEKRKANKNFIGLLKQIREAPYNEKLSKEILNEKLEKLQPIILRNWLKNKVKKLKK